MPDIFDLKSFSDNILDPDLPHAEQDRTDTETFAAQTRNHAGLLKTTFELPDKLKEYVLLNAKTESKRNLLIAGMWICSFCKTINGFHTKSIEIRKTCSKCRKTKEMTLNKIHQKEQDDETTSF